MHLSIAELARLELMFASGQVRSDPPALSATDRMMDAMVQAAQTGKNARMDRRTIAQTAREAALADERNDDRTAGRDAAEVPHATAAGGPGESWIPRSLEELIQMRRALMCNEPPDR